MTATSTNRVKTAQPVPEYGQCIDAAIEVEHRMADGYAPLTLKELAQELARIGYALDRSGDCRHVARYMTGPRAGNSYPCVSLRLRHIATGLGAFHCDAPRDDNFTRLQEWRMNQSHYAVRDGVIYEI